LILASGQISQIFSGKDWSANTAAATPVLGSHVVHQSRRLYVGNIPFGVSEVRKELLIVKYMIVFHDFRMQ
jgi:hypothetical protein